MAGILGRRAVALRALALAGMVLAVVPAARALVGPDPVSLLPTTAAPTDACLNPADPYLAALCADLAGPLNGRAAALEFGNPFSAVAITPDFAAALLGVAVAQAAPSPELADPPPPPPRTGPRHAPPSEVFGYAKFPVPTSFPLLEATEITITLELIRDLLPQGLDAAYQVNFALGLPPQADALRQTEE